ncbi:Spo0B domain-containing protein [Alicyclobacillus mengziensis]|uniref:Spo0B domain-containing protein n=1 Tax=Alicyclobacillus mengziensis TaxID=2931921 RepID=A0A9X7VVX1_9BACL|nr:Spo0B domain-containing protein [Alicyclobacillus mengziensis]QSO45907.1 Spo0B domain-containing protein [Alicyclobacillus mengziensis]
MSQSPWSAFQSHRHDIQNYLQLMKAYLQLGKPDRASIAIDECSDWLASLSALQNSLSETEYELFWTAASCSHLRIRIEDLQTSLARHMLCDALVWLDEWTVEHNIKYIIVEVSVFQTGDEALQEDPRAAGDKWRLTVETSEGTRWQLPTDVTFPNGWSAVVEIVPRTSREEF